MSRKLLLWFSLLCLTLPPVLAPAAVDIEIVQRLALPDAPLDAVMTPDGKYIYVLTGSGNVIVYNARGKQTDVIAVGKEVNAIRMGPGGDSILLLSPDKRQVSVAQVNFTYAINIEGSPFKGRGDAPVVLVVFSDFQ